MRKQSPQEVLETFKSVHGDKYDYSLVEYLGGGVKVKIVCKVHGVFEILPGHHKNGVGCKKCYFEASRTSKESFVEKSRKFFGDKHDYSLFDQLPAFGEKVKIKCNRHNEIFEQEARAHMRGHDGCPKCKSIKHAGIGENRVAVTSPEELSADFAKRASELNGDKYDYSEYVYVNANTKGKIICREHGEFWQNPSNHLRGSQCPKCSLRDQWSGTFKEKCKEMGVDYWVALKRRESGLSEDLIFKKESIRGLNQGNKIKVYDTEYPNLIAACEALKPAASANTIKRLIIKGVPAEEAFDYIPNPGFADGIIYVITHKESGKKYVGLTIQTLERRWKYHIEQSNAGLIKSESSLHHAIREFGPDAFEMSQLDSGKCKDDLERNEREWIEKLGTMAPNGYNLHAGGVSGGSCPTPKTVDGKTFPSVKKAVEYVSETRGITIEAAEGRVRTGKLDHKKRAKNGESLVKTKAYKVWSSIVHMITNPRSKAYSPGIEVYERWRDFDAFLADVGQPPDKNMSFVRRVPVKGFFPDNCYWEKRGWKTSKSSDEELNLWNCYDNVSVSNKDVPTHLPSISPVSVLTVDVDGGSVSELSA